MRAYAYSNSIQEHEYGNAIRPGWQENFRAIYIVHCECRHYFAIECEGVATVFKMGSIGKCREIEVELSCPRCGGHISEMLAYPIEKLSRTPGLEEVYKMLDKLLIG